MTFNTLGSKLNEAESYEDLLFVGTVVDNADPDGLERVKATIPGIYETKEDCLWIGPAKNSPFGVGKGYGTFGAPAIGSTLLVELQKGDPHFPIYHGCILMGSHKTAAQKDEFHKDAWGFQDPDGNKLVVDMASHTTTFTSKSKVVIAISSSGDLTVTTPGSATFEVGNDLIANVSGNMRADVGGTTDINSGGTVSINGSTIQLNGG